MSTQHSQDAKVLSKDVLEAGEAENDEPQRLNVLKYPTNPKHVIIPLDPKPRHIPFTTTSRHHTNQPDFRFWINGFLLRPYTPFSFGLQNHQIKVREKHNWNLDDAIYKSSKYEILQQTIWQAKLPNTFIRNRVL